MINFEFRNVRVFMGNAVIDYNRLNELEEARKQDSRPMSNPESLSVQKRERADKYPHNNTAENSESDHSARLSAARNGSKNNGWKNLKRLDGSTDDTNENNGWNNIKELDGSTRDNDNDKSKKWEKLRGLDGSTQDTKSKEWESLKGINGGGMRNTDEKNNGGDHSARLSAARDGSKSAKGGGMEDVKKLAETAKNVSKLAATGSPKAAAAIAKDVFSLFKHVDFLTDIPFAIALYAALIKDLIDLVAFETVILPMIFSALCSIFIFMMLLISGSSGQKNAAKNFLKRIGVIGGGGIVDAIPGLGLLPVETTVVAVAYIMVLIERKEAQEEAKNNKQNEEQNDESVQE